MGIELGVFIPDVPNVPLSCLHVEIVTSVHVLDFGTAGLPQH